jgi:hypothetical protein
MMLTSTSKWYGGQHVGWIGAIMLLASLTGVLHGNDNEPAKDRAEELIAHRFELMQSRVAALKVESDKTSVPSQFAANPIFKYSDPARGYVAASVWKLGEHGRPLALLAVELDRNTYGRPCIGYEYGSLTNTPFKVTFEKSTWSPKSTRRSFVSFKSARSPNGLRPPKSSTRRSAN